MTTQRARILVFTGPGKGKTTAALGMALRAAGHGMRVEIVQFVKQDRSVGEFDSAARLPGVSLRQVGRGFLPPPSDAEREEHCRAAREGLREVEQILAEGRASLVVLDEICFAVAHGLVEEGEVLSLLDQARPGTCLVLTGRGATEGLLRAADTVTEMRQVKHGFDSGIAAQQGVEW
jgi:cob(I)alamin adenosyltransferase